MRLCFVLFEILFDLFLPDPFIKGFKKKLIEYSRQASAATQLHHIFLGF
jgi:hypothetical protein